jgi:hypothetical protein
MLWTVAARSTVWSATLLLARVSTSECGGADAVLGAVGLAVSAVPCAGLVIVWYEAGHVDVRRAAARLARRDPRAR